MPELIATRKEQHIDLCANHDVEATDRGTGFARLSFRPCTLPELDWHELDTRAALWGRTFAAPFVISGMTFGVERSAVINHNLARCAAHHNIPMGVGSQRIALEHPAIASENTLRRHAPDIFLLANLGISHLQRDFCLRAVEMLEANALAIHLNVMQELIQPEGSRNFRGILHKLSELTKNFPVPIIVKEVGFGIDVQTATRLYESGITALDVGGKGGTSWSWIEGLRSDDNDTRQLAQVFRNWGIPTSYNTALLRAALPHCSLLATGGVRDGLTAAKALALGANLVGLGLPLLKAALVSDVETIKVMDNFIRGLKITMLTTGSAKIADLAASLCLDAPYRDKFTQLMSRRDEHT